MPRIYSVRRYCLTFLSAGAAILLIFSFATYLRNRTSDNKFDATMCHANVDVQKNLLRLASAAHHTFTSHNVTHFLCYGTLWGALRRQAIFPWKRDFDFCIDNDDVIGLMDEAYLRRLFRVRGIDMTYSNTKGVYTAWDVNFGPDMGILNIFVFEKWPGQRLMRRVGLHRLMPLTSDRSDSFPTQLLSEPLSEILITGEKFPAPREGVEIQKYHYADNWWLEIKPEGCG